MVLQFLSMLLLQALHFPLRMFQKQVMQYVASSELCNTWRVKDAEVIFLIGLDFVG